MDKLDGDDEKLQKYSWMIRKCELYQDEYSDCTSIRGRLHQYFVYGSFQDCSQWGRDYDCCIKWKESGDKKAYKEILMHEINLRKERLKANEDNDTWEKRTEPPKDWNAPLPPHLAERAKNSYLTIITKNPDAIVDPSSLCTIL